MCTGSMDKTPKANRKHHHKPASTLKTVLFFVSFFLLAMFGVYLMFFAEWPDLGLPLAFGGIVMIIWYLTMRRTLRRMTSWESRE